MTYLDKYKELLTEERLDKVYHEVIGHIRTWFETNGGSNSVAVIGISGGKDSTVSAKLLVDALGADRVFGVLMPNGTQSDIEDSHKVCELLGIDYEVINIDCAFNALTSAIHRIMDLSDTTLVNLAPRLRMATLYAVAQSIPNKAFVVNTCNASEDYVGYSTKWGDNVGDYSVLRRFLVSDVVAMGDYLGLPKYLVHKIPSDGLCGLSDEENLGVSYDEIDEFILFTNKQWDDCELSPLTKLHADLIEEKHKASLHKDIVLPYC